MDDMDHFICIVARNLELLSVLRLSGFSTSWTTLELDVSNTRTRLLVSRIQFPTDRSDDPLLIKVCEPSE